MALKFFPGVDIALIALLYENRFHTTVVISLSSGDRVGSTRLSV